MPPENRLISVSHCGQWKTSERTGVLVVIARLKRAQAAVKSACQVTDERYQSERDQDSRPNERDSPHPSNGGFESHAVHRGVVPGGRGTLNEPSRR